MILLIMLMGLLMLTTTACVPEDADPETMDTPTSIEDLTPGIAEWAITLTGGVTKGSYIIGAIWIGSLTPPMFGDTATLSVNGVDTEIWCMAPGIWFGSCNATEGADATVKFVYNGTTKTDTSIKMVNVITDSNFPATYNPALAANISWTLPADNQHQVVGLSATKDSTSVDYSREIAVDARSYTFPAHALNNAPAGATYSLGVTDVNFKIKSKVALMSITGAGSGDYNRSSEPESMRLMTRKLLKALTK